MTPHDSAARYHQPRSGLHAPPPLILAGTFVVGLLLERSRRRRRSRLVTATGWAAVVAGLVTGAWAIGTFWRARTTVLPGRTASRLVTCGPYGLSRNPMYCALSLVYLGLATVLRAVWPVLLWPAALLTLYRLVIRDEESRLQASFGEEYTLYHRRVPRFL